MQTQLFLLSSLYIYHGQKYVIYPHFHKIIIPQPIPTLYLWNECTTRYDGARSLTNMEILVI